MCYNNSRWGRHGRPNRRCSLSTQPGGTLLPGMQHSPSPAILPCSYKMLFGDWLQKLQGQPCSHYPATFSGGNVGMLCRYRACLSLHWLQAALQWGKGNHSHFLGTAITSVNKCSFTEANRMLRGPKNWGVCTWGAPFTATLSSFYRKLQCPYIVIPSPCPSLLSRTKTLQCQIHYSITCLHHWWQVTSNAGFGGDILPLQRHRADGSFHTAPSLWGLVARFSGSHERKTLSC